MKEVGVSGEVAPPIYIHHHQGVMPLMSTKKRDLSYQSYHQQQNQRGLTMGFQTGVKNWNPKIWNWDSVKFVSKPVESDVLHLGSQATVPPEQQKTKKKDEDAEQSLRLNLGGALGCGEEPVSRPNKRVRSGSPGNANYPMCQVDNCKEDLSRAKDYHRRHKVCEHHSKSAKALVGKQMQRFCQQCSRFHPLSEFDEGKRSCRRRLAGHNRRRRKTQPDDNTSRMLLPGNQDNPANKNLDIVNLLTVLAHAQGSNEQNPNCSAVPDKDQLIQILNKLNSLPLPEDIAAKSRIVESLRKIIPEQTSLEHQNRVGAKGSSPSTRDLLAVLIANSPPPAPDAIAIQSQSSHSSDSEKTKSTGLDHSTCLNTQKQPTLEFHSTGVSSTSYQSRVEDSDCQIPDTQVNLPLQLFNSSPETDSPPKLTSASKYFSSDSSNPTEDRSPSSSPVVQKLFPVQASRESLNPTRLMRGVNTNVEAGRTRGFSSSFDLFGGPNKGTDIGSFQSSPYQNGYTSSSGSDHSPSSLSSDSQDRTGRIIFKLFDKDPSHFPGTLRAQVYNWLSNSPSEMESYIRPGCVILSIYVAMSSASWDQLEGSLLQRVNALVEDSATDFWRSGRFLVHTGKQLASHKNGKLRLCKSWRTWTSPELILVSPLAIVGGQETSLILKGRNLANPGTKIHCTSTGGYTSKEVSGSTPWGTMHNEMDMVDFKIRVTCNAPSRCFIEVENGFKGNSFPLIIADLTICRELRQLESEFDEDAKMDRIISDDNINDVGQTESREDVLHFLNELGWLFQRKRTYLDGPEYSLNRFKFLLTFSVEKSFCALVKFLLDILVERNKGTDGDGLSVESLDMVSDIQLLSRAVKRKCRKMVDMLINYSVIGSNSTSKIYVFPPNLVGPGGLTPLHLAACTGGSDEMVDALTNDPLEIGLHCWNSLLDASGQSPSAYAVLRNNHSYNRLVARKLADKRNGQVTLSIDIEQPQLLAVQDQRLGMRSKRGAGSCAKCAVVASKYSRRMPGGQGLLHRPYIHSMLAVAAVCVCVCLFFRGSPNIGLVGPFKWENLHYGTI